MTHKKKKMIKRNHKKMSHRSKRLTTGAASVLLGTGIMVGANARPVKATTSREDEISEVESVNVLSSEKAKVRINVKQRAAVVNTSTENDENQNSEAANNLESQASPASLTNENLDNGDASSTETKTPTYEDAADKVEDINAANDSKLQDAIDEAENAGVNIEVSDKKEDISTTVGGIEENKDKLSQYTDAQIKEIQKYLAEHKAELEKYKDDKANYDKAVNDYINKLIDQGLLKEEDKEEAKKGELGQQLVLDLERDAQVDAEVLNKDRVTEEYNSRYMKEYFIDGSVDGDFLKLTYTNPNRSSYKGEKIGKIEITYSDLIMDRRDRFTVYTAYYIGEFYVQAQSITVTVKLYDSEGKNLIVLDENTAFLSGRGYGVDDAEVISSETTKGMKNENNIFNVSGDSIKIKYNGSRNIISSWFSTDYLPKDLNFNAEKPKQPSVSITPGQLVLNDQAHVNIHYVDVNGKEITEFSPEDGEELADQLQKIDHLAVGDSYTNDLWSWGNAGYVLATDGLGSGIINDKNGDIYIYLKHGTENVDQQQKVNFVVHHKNASGTSVAEDQVFELVFNRIAARDKVNGNISGSWTLTNPQILSTLDSSVMNNLFGAGKIDPSTGAVGDDVLQELISSGAFDAVMVHATETPETPTNPGQDNSTPDQGNVSDVVTPAPETPSTPTLETEESTPETDDEVSFPPAPEEVFGTYPHQPESDEDETEESVTPHAQKEAEKATKFTSGAKVEPIQNVTRDANPAPDAVSTQAAEVETESSTSRHADEATLPETGEEQSELATIFSMLAAALGITGLAGTSKRRKKDK